MQIIAAKCCIAPFWALVEGEEGLKKNDSSELWKLNVEKFGSLLGKLSEFTEEAEVSFEAKYGELKGMIQGELWKLNVAKFGSLLLSVKRKVESEKWERARPGLRFIAISTCMSRKSSI